MKEYKLWTGRETATLIKLAKQKVPMSEIAEILGRSVHTIRKKIYNDYAIRYRHRFTKEDLEKIYRLHKEGVSGYQIAIEMGTETSKIYYNIKKMKEREDGN